MITESLVEHDRTSKLIGSVFQEESGEPGQRRWKRQLFWGILGIQ
jgi:hypothetical protein